MNTRLEQLIRERAYEIWEARQAMGMVFIVTRSGQLREISAEDDWLMAEDEVLDMPLLPEDNT
jgi:hypothetical protein